jgi:hypothetical protein
VCVCVCVCVCVYIYIHTQIHQDVIRNRISAQAQVMHECEERISKVPSFPLFG